MTFLGPGIKDSCIRDGVEGDGEVLMDVVIVGKSIHDLMA